jgi:hypothetical protein
MVRKIGTIALLALLVLAVGAAGIWGYGRLSGPVVAQASEDDWPYKPGEIITVIGQASVGKAPDLAHISIGVETVAETVAEAVKENDAKMKAILEALTKAGIAAKDIQTMNYSISFERYPEPLPESSTGGAAAKPQYRVSNTVNVTVRQLDAVDDLLDAVIEAGANSIWGVSFGLDKPEVAQSEARGDAVADAKARAQALADLSGVKLGPVASISEVSFGGVIYEKAAMDQAAGFGSISPGELEITYQVQVSYFIER